MTTPQIKSDITIPPDLELESYVPISLTFESGKDSFIPESLEISSDIEDLEK